MRPRVALISLLAGVLGACASDPPPPQLAYAPPDVPPAEPGVARVGQPAAGLIWNQLLDRLNQSSLQVELADAERGIIVASYSGDPEPYVTCGWILVSGDGKLDRVAASGEANFDRVVGGRSYTVGRDLKLDARLVVAVRRAGGDALVEADSNYVLTKTVVAERQSGQLRGRSHEVVSFSTGERGEFDKSTVCQPTGDLEAIVLDILPGVTHVARPAQLTDPAPTEPPAIVATEIARDDPPQSPPECATADQVFCEVIELTSPYRRANQERGLGLEVDDIEGGNPLLSGGGPGLDISLPRYDAYLAVSYFLRDGTVRHVLSGMERRWPANAREFVTGLSAGESGSVEMVVTLASEVPLFGAPRPPSETVEAYLTDLRRRLAEITGAGYPTQIAASLMVVTPRQPAAS